MVFTGIFILMIFFFCWLYYISKADKGFATYSKGINTEVVSSYDLTNGIYDKELIHMVEYANLCDIVYRRPDKSQVTKFNGWQKSLMSTDKYLASNSNKNITNLYFEIWEFVKESDDIIIAIVLRGTEFTSLSDWKANLRWFIKGIDKNSWDHYNELGKINLNLVNDIKEHYSSFGNNLRIISTGHSLGGGLAQYMAYSIPDINLVYAFDASPVTGYYDVKPRSRRVENKRDAVIYRIYESGEGLSFARKFMTILYPAPLFKIKNPALIRIRFSFRTGISSIDQHSISELAKSLISAKEKFM